MIKVNYSNIYSTTVNKLASINPDMQAKLSISHDILKEMCKKASLYELHEYMKNIFIGISKELEKNDQMNQLKKFLIT